MQKDKASFQKSDRQLKKTFKQKKSHGEIIKKEEVHKQDLLAMVIKELLNEECPQRKD